MQNGASAFFQQLFSHLDTQGARITPWIRAHESAGHTLAALWITHDHGDHLSGLGELAPVTHVPIVAHVAARKAIEGVIGGWEGWGMTDVAPLPPVLPDTCHCKRCLALAKGKDWVTWRCSVFTDWVREFKQIRDRVRPKALLGTFHCPWSDDAKLKSKLAIDLRAQAKYIDVFSPMPYHARFGHAKDPAWISRQVKWLGDHLGKGTRIWPIVQLADWGEPVPVEQIASVIDHGSRPPATGVMVFAWGRLRKQPAKIEAMVRAFK